MCDQSKIFLCVYQKFVKVDFVHEELIENSIMFSLSDVCTRVIIIMLPWHFGILSVYTALTQIRSPYKYCKKLPNATSSLHTFIEKTSPEIFIVKTKGLY